MIKQISVIMMLTITPASSGELANSYGHLPIKKWTQIGMRNQVYISQEIAKEHDLKDTSFINACMMMFAGDIRFNDLPISRGIKACVTIGKREQAK